MIRFATRRIWRAFPELDAFDDTRCRWFTRVAARRDPWRHLHRLAIVLLCVGALFFGLALVAQCHRWHARSDFENTLVQIFWLSVSLVAILATAAVPLVGGLVLRDWFLRRRLRRIVRGQGRCPRCGYTLLGLPIPRSLILPCPECGHESRVDPALHELTRRDERSFEASTLYIEPRAFWSRERVRWWAKATLLVLLGAIVVTAIPAACHEWTLRRQAEQARREAPGIAEWRTIIERHNPGALGADRQVTGELINALLLRVREMGVRQPEFDGTQALPFEQVPWFDLASVRSGNDPWGRMENGGTENQIAMRWLGAAERLGFWNALDSIADAPRFVQIPDEPSPATPLVAQTHTRALHALLDIALGRLALVVELDRDEEIVAALETSLALARQLGDQGGFGFDGLVLQRSNTALQLVRRWLARPVEPVDDSAAAKARRAEILASLQSTLERFDSVVDAPLNQELQRFEFERNLAWIFSDPSRVRFQRLSDEVTQGTPFMQAIRPGTWSDNRDALQASWQGNRANAALPATQRIGAPGSGATGAGAVSAGAMSAGAIVANRNAELAIKLGPSWFGPRYAYAEANFEMMRTGLIIWIAVERFRNETGALPPTLDALVPRFLGAVPSDPFGAGPWRYRLHAIDGARWRRFVLYSVAQDGVDNGGRPFRDRNVPAADMLVPVVGHDAVINDCRPIPPPK